MMIILLLHLRTPTDENSFYGTVACDGLLFTFLPYGISFVANNVTNTDTDITTATATERPRS